MKISRHILLLLIVLMASYGWATTYFISPTGSDANNGTAQATPFKTFSHAIPLLNAGDSLNLLNGTYSASSGTGYPNINCTSGAHNGTSGSPVTIQALNERQALIQGDGTPAAVVYMNNCAYWNIVGLHVEDVNQGTSGNTHELDATVSIYNSSHITVRRNVIAHTNQCSNLHQLVFFTTTNSLAEENELYYFHRHAFVNWDNANNNEARRNYASQRNWGGSHVCSGVTYNPTGDDGAFISYGSQFDTYENNISEGSNLGRQNEAIGTAPSPCGVSVTNIQWLGEISLNNGYGLTTSPHSVGSVCVPLNITIKNFAVVNPRVAGIYLRTAQNSVVSQASLFTNSTSAINLAQDKDGGSGNTALPSATITNSEVISGVHPPGFNISNGSATLDHDGAYTVAVSNVSASNPVTANPAFGACYLWVPSTSPLHGAGAGGTDIGATVLYQYVAGALTTTKLWDTTTGAPLFKGATVTGLNDVAGTSLFDIANRLNINKNGCIFPASYVPAATPPPPTLNPTALNFPDTVVQQVSSGLSTTLTNPGSAPITINSISNTGTNANQFVLTNPCGTPPFSLAAAGTCVLTERLAPTSVGAKVGTLNVTSSTGNVSAALAGNGIVSTSTLTISPASIPFGTVPLGTASAPQTATVQNTGNFPALFTSVATSGDFAVTNNCTNASLSDTFAAGSLDLTKWAIDTGNIGSQTLGTASTGSAANVDLSQGVLGLKLTQATAANSVGAEVRSLNSFSYGTYEFTARASSTSVTKNGAGSAVTGGVTGLFNFVNNSQTEIDFEIEGQSTGTLEMTNWAGTGNKTATTQAEAGMDTAFHTYKFVWMPDHIDYYFDGALISTHSTNIPNTPAPILLNHWGTNSASFGGVASVGTTRWTYISSVKFTPALAPQASCNLPLVFTPTAAGARTGTLTVTSNASNSPNTASLAGTGAGPVAQWTPTSLACPNTVQGSTQACGSAVLKNIGAAPLHSTLSIAANFTQTNTCPSPVVLAPNGSCTVNVTFAPGSAGAKSGNLTSTDDGGSPVVALSGTGLASNPQVALSAVTLNFPSTIVGNTSANMTETITNTGTATLNVSSVTKTGGNTGDFNLVNGTCGAAPFTLGAGLSCTQLANFHPSASGTRTTTMVFTDDAPDVLQMVTLNGIADASNPTVTLSVTNMGFGNQQVSTTSLPNTLNISNTGNATLLITSTLITSGQSDFAVSASAVNPCGGSLAAGANCNVDVLFTPSALGTRNGTLTVTTNAASSPDSVTLQGSGQAPPTFGPVAVFMGGKAFMGGRAFFGTQPATAVIPPIVGSYTYNACTATSIGVLENPLPNFGILTGANTVLNIPEPCGTNTRRMARLTDASTITNGANRTFQISFGGSADETDTNIDSTLIVMSDTGGSAYPMSFDPSTMHASLLYAASFPTTGGLTLSDSSEYSKVNSQLLYSFVDTTAKVVSRDFTNRVTPPTPVTVVDYKNGSANCLGAGFTPTWQSVGGVGGSDLMFASAFSNAGGQGTGVYIVAWKRGFGCRMWNTQTGVIIGDWGATGTVTAADRFTIHNVKISKGGDYLVVVRTTCLSGTCQTGPYFWNIATTTVTPCPARCGGHFTEGNLNWVNDAGAPFGQKLYRQFTDLSTITNLVSTFPTNPAITPPLDTHLSYTNANATDSLPFFLTTDDTGAHLPYIEGWENEINGVGTSGTDTGKVWRFAHTYNSGLSHRFATKVAIGSVSQDGRYFFWSSDMMGGLGSEAGASSCTIGTNCRGDVFAVELNPVQTASNQEDLLNWALFQNRTAQHLSGTWSYLDGDTSLTTSAGQKFWWLKTSGGGPGWDINPYDSQKLYLWITENGDEAPTNASAYKRFLSFVPFAPRNYILDSTVTFVSPGSNQVKRTINCEADNEPLITLGHIKTVTTTVRAKVWGGDLGTRDTVLVQYFWGGTDPSVVYNTREQFWLVKGFGRAQWDTAHWDGVSAYVTDSTVTHNTVASGNLVAPNFACGFGPPGWQ